MDILIKNALEDKIDEIIKRFDLNIKPEDKLKIIQLAYDDLYSYSVKDPSSNNDMLYVLETYSAYYAVLMYRVAHFYYENVSKLIGRKLSEYAKLKTGIEIHPAAKIGRNFVLDHGVGTVIGETTVIGDNCYILQSVILGSSKISNNSKGRRHPTIGNNVDIGGFVRIYGPVTIGNNVKISPGAIIRNSIPDNTKVIVSSNYQISVGDLKLYYTGYQLIGNKVTLFFKGNDVLENNNIKIYQSGKLIPKFQICNNSLEFQLCYDDLSDIYLNINDNC